MKRTGVLKQKSLSDSYPSASTSWRVFSILDPVAVGAGKENLALLPKSAMGFQGSPAPLVH
jgi:hypothetical protein